MKRFFGAEKSAPALSMLPQRSLPSNDGTSDSDVSPTLAPPTSSQSLAQSRTTPLHSPAPSYLRANAEAPQSFGGQQQHYFDLAAASTLYMQSVGSAPSNSIQTPAAVLTPSLTPPPPRERVSPLPSPARLPTGPSGSVAGDDSYSAVNATAATAFGQAEASAIDRTELHKILRSLEGLLVGMDEYRELAQKMAKVEKKIARSVAEISKIKSVKHVPSQVLGCSALHFDMLHDVDNKHAKLVQKEYEAVNDACAKYFKRIAKEERAHDDLVDNLDTKIKKAHASQEKNAKRAGPRAVEAHDKYIAQVQALTNDVAQAKAAHAVSMGAKTHAVSLIVASTVGGLADARYRAGCEAIRKTGKEIGPLNAWMNFAISEAMPDNQPVDMDDDETGPAQRIEEARRQAQAQAYAQQQAQLQAQAQATQAFAQAQMQSSAAALLAAQQLQLQKTPLDTLPPATTLSNISAEPEALPSKPEALSVKFVDLPKLDSDGRLVEKAITKSADVASDRDAHARASTANVAEAAEVKRLEAKIGEARSSGSNESASKVGSNDSSISQRDDVSLKAGGKDTSHRQVGAADAVASPLPTASQELHRTPTASTLRSTVAAPELPEDTRSSVLNLAASLTIPGADSQHEHDTATSSRAGSSRRGDSDSTPSLTNSSSRLGSEDSGPIASPRPTFAMSNPTASIKESASDTEAAHASKLGAKTSPDYDHDRYAPVVGQSRISSVSVSRTLSTDTTASERSFVARMKAKYQAEKEGQRGAGSSQGPSQIISGPSSPPADMPPPTRRVSDIASQYAPRQSYPAGGPASQAERPSIRPQATPPAYGGMNAARPRHLYAADERPPPSTASSRFNGFNSGTSRDAHAPEYNSVPSSGRGSQFRGNDDYHDRFNSGGGTSEFGSVKMGRPGGDGGGGNSRFAAMDAANEAPHSDVCGCQRCSIRHYNDAGTDSGPRDRGAYENLSYRSSRDQGRDGGWDRERDPRAQSNARRQTLPASGLGPNNYGPPPSDSDRYDSAQRDFGREPNRDGRPSYEAQHMKPPPADRFVGRDRDPRDYGGAVGGGSGRASPYGSLARDEGRFAGQSRVQPVRS